MSISATLSHYLEHTNVDYDLIEHTHTNNSVDTAIAARVPMEHLAKAVVLIDEHSEYMMAVMPSTNKLKLRSLNKRLGRNFQLVSEVELKNLFQDCELGAVPALGQAYHMDMIVDEQLLQEPHVYIEAGDHQGLVHVKKNQFVELVGNKPHALISSTMPDYPVNYEYDA